MLDSQSVSLGPATHHAAVFRSVAALSVLMCVIALTGCSDRVIGTWQSDDGDVVYDVRGDGQVIVTLFGSTVAARYRRVDDALIVSGPQGTIVLDIEGDVLVAPTGLRLTRRTP